MTSVNRDHQLRAGLLLIPVLLAGCDQRPGTIATVAGVYVVEYPGGSYESFDLAPNRTFTQTFHQPSAADQVSTGTWSVQGREVTFAPFTEYYSIFDKQVRAKPEVFIDNSVEWQWGGESPSVLILEHDTATVAHQVR